MKILYKDESYRIIGACFEVYNQMGVGFLEAVYQECLGIEFGMKEIPFESQVSLNLKYKGEALNQRYVPDFICYQKIILEIKVAKCLTDQHRAQVHNYLRATGIKLGLLVNFGTHPKLQHERVVY